MVVARIPNTNPRILQKVGSFPVWILLYSGLNSPDTIYNIAPPAKARHIAIICCDIFPMMAPKKAPNPVAIPDKNT